MILIKYFTSRLKGPLSFNYQERPVLVIERKSKESMEGRKFGGKVTIDGHLAGHTGNRFEKTPKKRNLPTMNQTKIMVNDADESSSDELIVQIKKCRSLGLSQYPATLRLAVSEMSQ